MARNLKGTFDPQLRLPAWFDETMDVKGWFDESGDFADNYVYTPEVSAALSFIGAKTNQTGHVLSAVLRLDGHDLGGADYNATTDYQTRGGGLTGASDGKQGTLSMLFRLDGSNGSILRMFANSTTVAGGTLRMSFGRSNTNVLGITWLNVAGSTVLYMETVGTFVAGAAWYHMVMSWDMAVPGSGRVFVAGVSDKNEITFVNDTLEYTPADWSLAASPNGATKFDGALADVWFDTTYIDVGVEANLRKFVGLDGRPANLGANGELPTGVTPLLYQHRNSIEAVAAFFTNRGGGGNFTAAGTPAATAVTLSVPESTLVALRSKLFTAAMSFIGAFTKRPGPIAFDATSASGYQTAQASYSWNHTCSGTNRYLTVGISMLSVGGSSVSGVTYNGVAMALLKAQASGVGAVRTELWGLVNPASGSNTIAVTLSAALDSAGSASSYDHVHQTSSTEGANSATATNVGAADATVDVTTVTDNTWVVDNVATTDTAITVGAGQTSRQNTTGALGSGAMSDEGPKTPAGTATMSWTNVGAGATWSTAAVALRPLDAYSLTQLLTAALSFVGAQAKLTLYPVIAALPFSGAMLKFSTRAHSATLSFVGVWTKLYGKLFTATLSFIGVMVKRTSAVRTGTLSFIGAMVKRTSTTRTATLPFVGNISKSTVTARTAVLTFVGTCTRRVSTSRTATLSFIGAMVKRTSNPLAGTLSFIGAISKQTATARTATLSFIGAMVKRTSTARTGTLSFIGAMVRLPGKRFAATLASAGTIIRRANKALAATLSFVGASGKLIRRALTATLNWIGTLVAGTSVPPARPEIEALFVIEPDHALHLFTQDHALAVMTENTAFYLVQDHGTIYIVISLPEEQDAVTAPWTQFVRTD